MERYSVYSSDMDENVRLGITISRYDLRRLKIWAMLHGRAPTAYAAWLLTNQIESNFDVINRQLEDYAVSLGKTVDEVLAAVDKEANE
jgi:hypothetical protein